ncbi:Uncharacterised protein [uncultured archaeon]|nr:Uncharacterised protein [uncultured archaeon]
MERKPKSALLPTIGFSVMASAMLFSASKSLLEGRMGAGPKPAGSAATSVSDSELDKLLEQEFRRQIDKEPGRPSKRGTPPEAAPYDVAKSTPAKTAAKPAGLRSF